MIRRNKNVLGLLTAAITAAALLAAGCGKQSDQSGSTASGGGAAPSATTSVTALTGAGGTFPAPVYQKWFQEYDQAHNLQINYQPIGSGGGIKQITAKAVDFGASDAPMNDAELKAAPGIIHIPTVAGSVCVAYNAPGVPAHLHLTGPVIANMFLGTIKTWNDPQIAQLNPGAKLPATPVVPMHRSDGSGTTNIFTTYLSQISPQWKQQIGAGKSVKWVNGLGGKGNAGVAQLVQRTAGSVGYVELAYVMQNTMAFADVQNAKGKFIAPSVASATAAVEGVTLPDDFRAVPTNTANPQGYPITGFTFILVYPNAKPEVKGFLKWALTDGQKEAAGLFYAPLPDSVRKKALAKIATIQ